MHFLMPAPPLEFRFTYKDIGKPGPYSQDGTQTGTTSAGQKQSASNSLPALFSSLFDPAPPSLYMATIKGSSKHGTTGVAGTNTSTTYSNASHLSSYASIAASSLNTFPVEATPPTLFHTVFSPPTLYSCPASTSLRTSHPSSATLMMNQQCCSCTTSSLGVPKPPCPTLLVKVLQVHPAEKLPFPSSSSTLSSHKHSAEPVTTRPHCTAKERLLAWHPVHTQTLQPPLQTKDTQWLLSVLPFTWADSTKETYGSGLLTFHMFCNFKPSQRRKGCQ